jgi:hypothetical protein
LNNPTQAQDEQGAGAEASAITVTATFVDAGRPDRKMSQRSSRNEGDPSKKSKRQGYEPAPAGIILPGNEPRGVESKMDGSWHSGADRADGG